VLVYKAWELDPYKMYPKNKDKFPENFQIEVKYKNGKKFGKGIIRKTNGDLIDIWYTDSGLTFEDPIE